MGENGKPIAADWLKSSGEMGKVIRSMDWSKTPLGPIESWSQSLRTTVSLCLASNFPINIIWGPGRVQIYNDGYWPICGDKHPRSMGQDYKECWFSAWDALREPFERATAGETAFLENRRMFLDRNGYLEETFFTFSLSPIRNETGGVGGLFHPVTEMTQQTLTERRLKVLRDLADRTADAKTLEEACRLSAEALAAHELDLPFTLFYRLDPDGKQADLMSLTGLEPGSAACPTVVDLEASPELWALTDMARSSPADREAFGQVRQIADDIGARTPRPNVLDELEQRFGSMKCGPYPESPKSAIVMPIALPGLAHPWGVFVAGVSSRRALDEAYQTFYALLGKSVTTAISNAYAYEEERKQAEALAELDRTKTLFFSNVSHEFRTPLTLILAPLQDALSDRTAPLTSPHRERLELAHRNSLRLLKLVNTLLDFSRIEAGRMEAVYEPTDLAQFTAELASVFRSAIERAGLRLIVDCPPLPEPVYVDRQMWEKIVLNLLSNAFKFTFVGEITIGLRLATRREYQNSSSEADDFTSALQAIGSDLGSSTLEHDFSNLEPKTSRSKLKTSTTLHTPTSLLPHVVLEVRDTGTGIPPEDLPHLFERFYQVRGAKGRTHEGSGIGLALVHELIRLHGGTIDVSSTLRQGTCFSIALPFGTAHLPTERIQTTRTLTSTAIGAAPYVEEAKRWLPEEDKGTRGQGESTDAILPLVSLSPTPPLPLSSSSARVLLIDDNADMREYLTRILSEYVQVEVVADGATALAAALAQVPDLILSDVMMPGLDGFELLQALRSDPRTREVPIILLSARAGEEAIVEGLAAGADDYLIKPFSAQELVSRVNAHLQMAQLRSVALQEARSTIRRRDELVSAVSHELNTPLVSILGWTRLLRANPPSPSMLSKALDTIERNATLQGKLVQDLLDISRITTGKLRLNLHPVKLKAVIEMAITTVAQTAAAKGIDLVWQEDTTHSDTDSVVVMGDGDRLGQVLCNLLTNAIKFTPESGSVAVELSVINDEYSPHTAYAEIRVIDTGIGIAADFLSHVFDRFRQARDADAAKGLGLGLAIAYHLVELHNGTIHAESAGAGQGATFIVRLPLLETLL